LKFYIGSQIGLLEFDDVDIAISWEEEPVLRKWIKVNITGDEKSINVYKGGEVLETSAYIFSEIDGIKFAAVTGYDSLYPEFYHYARSKNASFVVSYNKTDGMAGFMNIKFRAWSFAQETKLVIFSIIQVSGKVYYGVYGPLYKYKEKNGIIIEGSSRDFLEVSFDEAS